MLTDVDILEIDKLLADDQNFADSDKMCDDASNILLQWKKQNYGPTAPEEEQLTRHDHALQINSKTFTRPKRKPNQNFELNHIESRQILNLQIGGLVTTLQRSSLQDISPPSSVSSSIDIANETMKNSLVTSADFTNISFLHLESNDNLDEEFKNFFLDRKMLESLNLSEDGMFSKDTQIGQTDDISLVVSKTASNCSTMNNSIDSVCEESGNSCINNQTTEMLKNQTFTAQMVQSPAQMTGRDSGCGGLRNSLCLNGEMIVDTTFDLMEDSVMCPHLAKNETFKMPSRPLIETVTHSLGSDIRNATFNNQITPEEPFKTPDHRRNNSNYLSFHESTPQSDPMHNERNSNQMQHQTPSLDNVECLNISPIAATINQFNKTCSFNHTYPKEEKREVIKTVEPLELLDNIENQNRTFNASFLCQELEESVAGNEMQHLMNMANAEARLLSGNDDEEEFEYMLDEFSKVTQSAKHSKMRKSLDVIRKRFNCGLSSGQNDEKPQTLVPSCTRNDVSITDQEIKTDILNSPLRSDPQGKSLNQSSQIGLHGNSGERLLSRRNRLYDDLNPAVIARVERNFASASLLPGDGCQGNIQLDELIDVNAIPTDEFPGKSDKRDVIIENELKGSVPNPAYKAEKYPEKRERNRDRFKTIKIVKQRDYSDQDVKDTEKYVKVPCIGMNMDESNAGAVLGVEDQTVQKLRRKSRFDEYNQPVFNNNHSERLSSLPQKKKLNNQLQFKTYSKPIDSSNSKHENRKEEQIKIAKNTSEKERREQKHHMEIRSLSRPRYILNTNIDKLAFISKAASSDPLENTRTALAKEYVKERIVLNTRTPANPPKLNSPMGNKAKSFHNLSSHFGFCGPVGSKPSIQKPNTMSDTQGKVNLVQINGNSKLSNTTQQLELRKNDESVFKISNVTGPRPSPPGGNSKRGLARPSSGHFSWSKDAKTDLPMKGKIDGTIETDSDDGECSPALSIGSSGSSHSSIQSKKIISSSNAVPVKRDVGIRALPDSTGIPKCSGLRPPANIRRSALPRPCSAVRR